MRNAKSRHVTKTGRAISQGSVTRASHSVRATNRKQEQPLPLHMMCHPKALTPTPLHPDCGIPNQAHRGIALSLSRTMAPAQFIRGKGLSRKSGRFTLYIQGRVRGYSDDPMYSLAYANAAKALGLEAHCYEI